MTSWTSDRVRDAAADWVWVPPGASEARTPEYHLIAYPDAWAVPTQVRWCRSTRAAQAVVDEVVAIAAVWGRPEVSFWTGDRRSPPDLPDHLRARGAVQVETVELLALELDEAAVHRAGLDAVERDGSLLCGGVEVREVRDAATLQDADLVNREVWGGEPPDEDLAVRLDRLTGAGETRVVAYLDGQPVATAGSALAGDVARLWGGATRAAHRGRGAYRATLAARLRLAVERGATLGMVRAVTTTSAPILHRLGFTGHGLEDRLRLPLDRTATDPRG